MAGNKTRKYSVDFYHVQQDGVKDTDFVRNLLSTYADAHATAHNLDDPNVLFQIRDIKQASADANVFKAVFGRLRHGEKPEQASTNGGDVDVDLLPGHGLVEKNHFLFFSDLNLIVFQRNSHAGRNSHLQAYLNAPNFSKISLTQILTTDSYNKLLNGAPLKKLEISIRKPMAALKQEDTFLQPLIDQLQGQSPGHLKVVLTASRGDSLPDHLKESLVNLSKFGRTSIARSTLVDDTQIDLLLDRVVGEFHAVLQENGRALPQHMFEGLATAKDECADDLENFFNP